MKYIEINLNGETKKFVLSETISVKDVEAGTNVSIKDKPENLENYDIIEVEIPGYPATGIVKEDNSTVVHQFYVLKTTNGTPEEPPAAGVNTNILFTVFMLGLGCTGILLTAGKNNKNF